jgi:biotin carboxyl carrier protein
MKISINEAQVPVENKNGLWLPISEGNYSVEWLSDDKMFLIVNGKTYTALCLSVDKVTKQVELLLNGDKYLLNIKEPIDDLLHDMGLDKSNGATVSSIKAPMPGMVLALQVEVGSKVSKGDKVLVLEAMKMENIIKSPGEGIVARILVNKGQTVDKNQVLIEFE